MKKIINFRAFLFIFIGAMIGVVFSLYVLQKNLAVLISGFVLAFCLMVFVIITKCFSKTNKFAFINKFLICLLIGFLFFSGLSVLNFSVFNKNLEEKQNVMVSARVFSVSEKNSYYYLILENPVLNEHEKVDGKIGFTLYCNDEMLEVSVGDKVQFNANLVANQVLKDGKFNSYYYKYNLKYYCYANSDAVIVNDGTLYFDEICREKVKNILFENLSYNNASISYASIFGDKAMLDINIQGAFSISGTTHLLCVSGLHVGFLVTLIYFLLNFCKVKKKYSFLIITIMLCLYCYLCGFSPSVVRASLMSIFLAFSDASGKVRYDSLSSLSLAGVLILVFKPFYVFDLGFQLSFSACFGIILLTPVFSKFFKKINFQNKISEAFCVSLSAQLGTFPILMHNFERLSFISLFANIIIVPLFSLIFMISLVFVILNLILPLGFLFKIVELGLNLVVFLTKSFGAVSECVFTTVSSPFMCNFLFYLALVLISGFVNLKSKTKAVCMLSCIVLCLSAFAFQFYPKTYNQSLLINSASESFTIITNSVNEKVLLSCGNFDENDVVLLKNDTFSHKIFKFDAFVLSNYNTDMQQSVAKICNNYKIKTLFLPENLEPNDSLNLFKNLNGTKIVFVQNGQSYSNFYIKINENLNYINLTIVDNGGVFTMVLSEKLNAKVRNYFEDENIVADYFKTKVIDKKYAETLLRFENVLCYKMNINQNNVFNINKICDKIIFGESLNYAF